jgi:purine-nucleoside phosphorylase
VTTFAEFERAARPLAPRAAVVLGSGLGDAASAFRETASVAFANIPGLVPTAVLGHTGRLAVGLWEDVPTLLFHGRLHFYEGHPREVVVGPVRVAAELGARRLVLTNAAGGIHPSLGPGSLMAIRAHIRLVGPQAWRDLPRGTSVVEAYSQRLNRLMCEHESAAGRQLPAGIYAALTGPCYETPAEIRALAACGADAVGMSTALEAEAAAELGLEVAAISCVTNKAAGLGSNSLSHTEVLANARIAVERLAGVMGRLVQST